MTLLHRPAGQRSDHIIGLEARIFQHRNAHRVERFANPGNLFDQIRRRLSAVRLVSREGLIAERRTQTLENRRQIFRFVHGLQPPDHVVKNVHRFGLQARRSPHRRRTRPRACMIRPKDKAKGIDQKKTRHCIHSTCYSAT